MRIVHVVLELHEGGLERIVVELVRHAERSGHQAHVVCLRRAGQLAAELAPEQCSVLSSHHRLSMLAPVALARSLRRLEPDIVHLHSGIWYKGAYACRLADCGPVVFTDHGRPHFPDLLTQRLLDGLGARMTDRVVAVSAPLAEYLANNLYISRSKISVIPNGIRLVTPPDSNEVLTIRNALEIPPGARVIGAVGRLNPIKAYDRLISAFAEVRKRGAGADGPMFLLLVGDGSERERLEHQAAALQLGNSIRFLGWRHDVHRLLALMDIFVLSSDSEGTSLSLLEAMASGVAVVATAVGGTPDVLGSSGAGTLVPPGDTGALASVLGALLRDPETRRGLGARGRARVEQQYSLEAMARAYEELYESMIRRGPHRPSGHR